jgi:hypothetical protein
MSDGAQIDYEALAKQAGAVSSKPAGVDYAALAKQAGAVDSQPATMAPGAIQMRKGGKVYSSPAEAAAAKSGADLAGIEAGEQAAAGGMPGGELGIGAVKGALNTGRNLGHLLTKTPFVGKYLGDVWPEAATGEAGEVLKPHDTLQKIGFGAEQAGEFLIPGSAEEKVAAKTAGYLPLLGRAAKPLARIATGALSTGAINAAQGGDFGSGALLGAGGGTVNEVGRAIAPSLAESALGITKRMRGFGKTPGEAALGEIRGIRPGTIAENAEAKLADLTSQLEGHAAKSTVPTTTSPAVTLIDREMHKAMEQNSKALYDQLSGVRDQLTTDLFTGKPLGGALPAAKLLSLKRGIGELEKTWNPEQSGSLKGIVRQVYHALDKELDRAVPESEALNQRISSLIPVAQRGESVDRGAGLTERMAHRIGAHTGALTSSAVGGALGYQTGGKEGAALGAVGGLALPELLASPAGKMAAARALRSPVPPQLLGRAASSQLLGRGKKTPEQE